MEKGEFGTGGTDGTEGTVAVIDDAWVKTEVTDVEAGPDVLVVMLVIGLIPLASQTYS